MTTLTDRPGTALIVVDVQKGVVDDAWDRDRIVGNIRTLVEKARDAETDVIWVQHSNDGMPIGSAQWQYVPELVRAESEPLVAKRFPDAFEETDFEAILAERGIGSIIVAGALTDECIRGTLHGALTRGYDATLVEDAHTAEDRTEWGAPPPEQVVALTNLYWKFNEAPGRIADTVATADLTF